MRMVPANYTGLVRDADNMHPDPLPGATLTFYNGQNVAGTIAAGNDGRFQFSAFAPVDRVVISHVGYKTQSFPLFGGFSQPLFELEKADTWLDPVVVTAQKKKPWLLYGLILFIVIKGMNKK